MAYTKSGQLPVGQPFKLGNYTFNLTVNSTGVIATVNDGEKGAAKGASFRNPQIKSWSVEANESEASVYVQFADEPDSYPAYISVRKQPYKLTYDEGETVALAGIEVRAFNADGTVWSVYPDGIIPISELLIQSVDEYTNKKIHVATSNLIEEEKPLTIYYVTSDDQNAYIDSYYSAHWHNGYLRQYNEHRTFELFEKTKLAFVRTPYIPGTGDHYSGYLVRPFISSIVSDGTYNSKELWNRVGSSTDGPINDSGTTNFYVYTWARKNGQQIPVDFGVTQFDGSGSDNYDGHTIDRITDISLPYIDVDTQQLFDYEWLTNFTFAMWYTDEGEERKENEIYHSATVNIGWRRPVDHKILTASFPIVIKEDNVDSGGEENG